MNTEIGGGSSRRSGGFNGAGLPPYVPGRYYGTGFDSVNSLEGSNISNGRTILSAYHSRGGKFDQIFLPLSLTVDQFHIKIFDQNGQGETLGTKILDISDLTVFRDTAIALDEPLDLPEGEYIIGIGRNRLASTVSLSIKSFVDGHDSSTSSDSAGIGLAAVYGTSISQNLLKPFFVIYDAIADVDEGTFLNGRSDSQVKGPAAILLRAA